MQIVSFVCAFSADCALPLPALRDLGSRGVPVDGSDDREAGARTPSQPLRLRQKGGWLLLLVPRRRATKEGVPGCRGPLVTRRDCPLQTEINVNNSMKSFKNTRQRYFF